MEEILRTARRKRLITSQEIQMLRETGVEHLRDDGQNCSDYFGVPAYIGAREKETYRLRWSLYVDWNNHQLNFGLDAA